MEQLLLTVHSKLPLGHPSGLSVPGWIQPGAKLSPGVDIGCSMQICRVSSG